MLEHHRGNRNNNNNQIMKPQIWENPLSHQQKQLCISRFYKNENIKLSYETVAPKKVLSSSEYDLCIAIPYGKKSYLWYTYDYSHSPKCLLLELNRDNQLSDNISIFGDENIPTDFELGTILSGTIYETENQTQTLTTTTKRYFVVDDIHMYKGIVVSKWCFHKKSGYLYDFFVTNKDPKIVLSVFWNNNTEMDVSKIPYNVRHIQYRATKQILPHYNISCNKKPLWNPIIISENNPIILSKKINININTNWKYDFSKPCYKRNAFFWIKADLAFDVYYLGALSKQLEVIYCQNALVLNFKTSVLLNTIFRNIRENQCLDVIEESDDEDEFEDVREDKFVDLEKECIMECYFHFKFKKWVPLSLVSIDDYKTKVISLQSLI
jgi:hypothetical protein